MNTKCNRKACFTPGSASNRLTNDSSSAERAVKFRCEQINPNTVIFPTREVRFSTFRLSAGSTIYWCFRYLELSVKVILDYIGSISPATEVHMHDTLPVHYLTGVSGLFRLPVARLHVRHAWQGAFPQSRLMQE